MRPDEPVPQPLAGTLVAAFYAAIGVLEGHLTPTVDRDNDQRPDGAPSVLRPHPTGLMPSVQLGEMSGRTNIAYSRLEQMFTFRVTGPPLLRLEKPLGRAFTGATARRYVCTLALMSHQLRPFQEASFGGLLISQLRDECGRRAGVPDTHYNLVADLRRREGFVIEQTERGTVVYLEPRPGQTTRADLSDTARSLCAEAVNRLLPFTASRVRP